MEIHVFLVVLMAALFHATWNAFVKLNGDRLLFMAVMMMGSGFLALFSLPLVALPLPESWSYILLSILIHQGYNFCLLGAYRYGDLSHVYPISRGSAPLIVAFVSVFVIGEALTRQGFWAVIIVGLGIMSLALTRNVNRLRDPWAITFALSTGAFIAGYTIVDGLGARLAGSGHSYAAWLLALEWIPITVFAVLTRGSTALPYVGRIWKPAALLGVANLAAYWAVIWAMTIAPIALVAALRETSIVFALIFGVVFLKEGLSLTRLASTMAILVGMVMLKISRS
jgi:drug/metabolite transporter (DMT)-like permease